MSSDQPLPPPPGGPGPASGAGAPSFDFARSFSFPFQDPDWLTKVLIGGVFSMLGIFLVGNFFVLGYLAKLIRNVVAGVERPMPAWDDLGGYFVEGFKLAMVVLVFVLPAVLIMLLAVIPAAILEGKGEAVGGLVGAAVTCLMFPLIIAMMVFLPSALTRAAAQGRAGAAFELGANFAYIKANLVNYVLAILVYIIANFVSQFGLLLLCVGVFFTGFLSMVMAAYAFGETYRLSPVK